MWKVEAATANHYSEKKRKKRGRNWPMPRGIKGKDDLQKKLAIQCKVEKNYGKRSRKKKNPANGLPVKVKKPCGNLNVEACF